MQRPRKNKPRIRWIPLDVERKILIGVAEPIRSVLTLIFATGGEISAVLGMRRRDIDLGSRTAHIPGTKTASRDREAIIEEWAITALERHCSSLHADDFLFPDLTRYMVHWHHEQACKRVGVEDLTVHDARHSLAVRWRKRGVSLEAIAAQLGHSSLASTMIYARFTPTMNERRQQLEESL